MSKLFEAIKLFYQKLNPLFRIVISVLVGITIATMVLGLAESLNVKLFPSTILNPTINEQEDLVKNAPAIEFLFILFGNMISAFFGGYTAARLAPLNKKLVCGFFVGFFLMLCAVFYFILIVHPIWFAIATGLSHLLFSYLGAKLAKN